ncbi:hypothetical protein QTP88_004888 [Uroleucon formosanum]
MACLFNFKICIICAPCKLFGCSTQLGDAGFNDWKNGHFVISRHENSLAHKNNTLSFITLQSDVGRIDTQLATQKNLSVKNLSVTCWSARFDACHALFNSYAFIIEALHSIVDNQKEKAVWSMPKIPREKKRERLFQILFNGEFNSGLAGKRYKCAYFRLDYCEINMSLVPFVF